MNNSNIFTINYRFNIRNESKPVNDKTIKKQSYSIGYAIMLKFRQLYLKLMYNKMLAGKTGLLHTNVRRYSRDCKRTSN